MLCACVSTSRVGNQNLAYLYSKENIFLRPEWTIHHESDSMSRLYGMVDVNQLLFSRSDTERTFTASLSIAYRLLPSYETKEIADSGTLHLVFPAQDEAMVYPEAPSSRNRYFDIPFHAILPHEYLLDITVTDLKRNRAVRKIIPVNKKNRLSHAHFLVRDAQSKTPFFRRYLHQEESVTVHYPYRETETLLVHYFNFSFPAAPPPFSALAGAPSLPEKPDSIYTIRCDTPLSFPKEGTYQILPHETAAEGLTLFRFHEDFPKVTLPEQLYEPVRYISTQQEYDGMHFNVNKRTAIDNFWLKIGSNYERARKVIKGYYNRVQDANLFFTSYKEGWKTDRGMIYIVFGQPNALYKSAGGELWIYGEEGNIMSLNFTFERMENLYTDNDYTLSRSITYKNNWYLAVDAWRQGVVY